jgi:predicted ATPase/class 3 adenylate cyclase
LIRIPFPGDHNPMMDRRSSAADGAAGVRAAELPSGTVAFMFTDIEGSTRMFRALGNDYGAVLGAHNEIIGAAVAGRGGVVVRNQGDGFFCAFAHPPAAIAAALEVQLALAAHDWPEGGEPRVRIGVHTGDADAPNGEYVSLAVHQAARVGDAGHGGQVIVSEATLAEAGTELPDGASLEPLGSYRLKDFPDPEPLYELRHPDLRSGFPALRALPATAHNVPEQVTLFVGRQTALEELARLVRNRRLVTVLGPGGVGKTRLAIELVPAVAGEFPHGVWLIELAHLSRGATVAPEVAGELGVRPDAERGWVGSIVDALRAKRLLLLLDNCEHVIDDAAALAEQLIAHCPQVAVLATSREPLGLAGEQRFPLAPLSVPDESIELTMSGSDAVALFVDRARAVAATVELPRDLGSVAEICRRLDGLPLAIELAAARVAAIPVSMMAARLDRRFALLTRGHRGALTHHETLRGSIGWSYDLLERDEQLLLARLGTFTGGFDLDAIEAVCAAAPLAPGDVLDLTVRLVEKSLVQHAGDRYELLDSIREFAREQLDAAGEVAALRNAHLGYYTELVEASAQVADGPQQRAVYDRLDADFGNIRAAVEFALERSDPAALKLGAALGQWGFVRNRLGEVARWCIDAAAAAPGAPAATRAAALAQAGFAFVVLGSPARGHALLDEGLELAHSVDDPRLLVDTLLMAADLRLEAGMPIEARALATEALAVAERIDDPWTLGRATAIEARAYQDELGYEETYRRLARAGEYFERAADRRQVGRVALTMAFLSLEHQALDAAAVEARRCLAICEEIGHTIGQAVARVPEIWVAIERGEPTAARELLTRAIVIARASGYVALIGYCVAAGAALRFDTGDLEGAARMLGALEANGDALGGEGGAAISVRVQRLRARLGEAIGDDRLAELIAEGSHVALAEQEL